MLEDLKKDDIIQERSLLVGVYGPETPRIVAEEYIEELGLLTKTAGGIPVDTILQNRNHPDPSTYVGKGKLRTIGRMVGERDLDTIIFDDDLSPTQIRNVEKQTEAKVLDRSGLILDIFATRAKTSAAKTQVELAQLQYLLPRLTRFWTHLSRQQGGIGTRGPGETQIETDRRLIDKRIATLKEKLDKLDQQRQTQRKGRTRMTRVSLVGYTNAGKSTLMNTLTDTEVLAEDRLFATLDSTVRRCNIGHHEVLMSDTVGFIRKLPHDLIESFKSTLDEVRESDILIHLVDASALMIEDYIEVVEETLKDLDVNNKKSQLVFNKVDKLKPQRIKELKSAYPESLFISAERGIGISKLKQQVEELIEEDYLTKTMTIPVSKYEAVAFLHRQAHILEKQYVGPNVKVKFSISTENYKRFENLLDNIDSPESVV